jgi:hypothetical protein
MVYTTEFVDQLDDDELRNGYFQQDIVEHLSPVGCEAVSLNTY